MAHFLRAKLELREAKLRAAVVRDPSVATSFVLPVYLTVNPGLV